MDNVFDFSNHMDMNVRTDKIKILPAHLLIGLIRDDEEVIGKISYCIICTMESNDHVWDVKSEHTTGKIGFLHYDCEDSEFAAMAVGSLTTHSDFVSIENEALPNDSKLDKATFYRKKNIKWFTPRNTKRKFSDYDEKVRKKVKKLKVQSKVKKTVLSYEDTFFNNFTPKGEKLEKRPEASILNYFQGYFDVKVMEISRLLLPSTFMDKEKFPDMRKPQMLYLKKGTRGEIFKFWAVVSLTSSIIFAAVGFSIQAYN